MSFRKLLMLIISLNLFVFSTSATSSLSVKIKDLPLLTPYEICSQKNETTKSLTIKQYRSDYEKTVTEALNNRNETIDYVFTISDQSEQNKLKDLAYTVYKDTQSSAQDEYLILRKITLKKFDTEQRTCKLQANTEK